MNYVGNTNNINTKQNNIENRNKESVLFYHGKPVIRSDFLNIIKNSDIDIKNKEECLIFLLNTREMLIGFLKKNKYPTQKIEISESIFNIGELVKLIKNEY